MARDIEQFLDGPLAVWGDVDAPLLDHAIRPYSPLFTRIDPKQIAAMTEASKEDLKPTAAAKAPVGAAEAATAAAAETPVAASAPPAKGGPGPGVATIGIDDFARLDLRVGKVVRSEEHTSELQSLKRISDAVIWLKKKKK